jgi:DNA modification methylase
MLIRIDALDVGDRLRELNTINVSNLRESIRTKGLLHAPVIVMQGDTPKLVCGMHRISAMQALHDSSTPFTYNGVLVPFGEVPATNVLDLSPADLLETELEENIIRAEIPWQDRARALAAIHELRRAENPRHTLSDTARELVGKGEVAKERTVRREVRNATILAENLHKPSVAKARNATEAMGILYKEEEAKLEAAVISRRHASTVLGERTIPLCSATLGDMRDVLPTLEEHSFDLIIADLPYGIGANSGGFRARTVEHHNYDDTIDNAKSLIQSVVSEGFRVAALRANLFVFGDVDLFPYFKAAASNMGWKPFRTPIIWQKSESEGLAPWGREGPRRTYEMVFYATKGQRGLLLSPTDVITIKRVSRSERRYGPEKPIELMRLLIECATMPGDRILDPCCGAGSTLAAARQLKRKALGIEIDPSAHALAVVAAERDTGMDTPAGGSSGVSAPMDAEEDVSALL